MTAGGPAYHVEGALRLREKALSIQAAFFWLGGPVIRGFQVRSFSQRRKQVSYNAAVVVVKTEIPVENSNSKEKV